MPATAEQKAAASQMRKEAESDRAKPRNKQNDSGMKVTKSPNQNRQGNGPEGIKIEAVEDAKKKVDKNNNRGASQTRAANNEARRAMGLY
jgi:hypothetical protein